MDDKTEKKKYIRKKKVTTVEVAKLKERLYGYPAGSVFRGDEITGQMRKDSPHRVTISNEEVKNAS